MVFIDATLNQSVGRLFPAYRILEEAERTFDPRNPPYNKIMRARKTPPDHENIQQLLTTLEIEMLPAAPARIEVLRELEAARKLRAKAEEKRRAERLAEDEEAANVLKAQTEGTMSECGCCFGDYPLNRMVSGCGVLNMA